MKLGKGLIFPSTQTNNEIARVTSSLHGNWPSLDSSTEKTISRPCLIFVTLAITLSSFL